MKRPETNSLHIIHYSEIERYPPILNLLDYINQSKTTFSTFLYSTKSSGIEAKRINSINYKRYGSDFSKSKFSSIYFIYFTIRTFINLIRYRPSTILYYESISSIAPILYKSIFKNVKINVHYHEYTSKKDYLSQNRFWVYFYKMEIRKFKEFNGISHTNEQRCKLFLDDHKDIVGLEKIQRIYPNYPPKSWSRVAQSDSLNKEVLKLVYVGYSVDEETSYVNNLVSWLSAQNIKTQLDIYCHLSGTLTSKSEGEIGNTTVREKTSVGYSDLPHVLVNYDIGLILYKGHTQNYIFNAPNKLFEYMVCGLDVWFPDVMEGPKKYVNQNNPKVISLDFTNLFQYRIENLVTEKSLNTVKQVNYFSESIYESMINDILC